MAQTPDDTTSKNPAPTGAPSAADKADAAKAKTPEATAATVEKSDQEKADEMRNEAFGEKRKGVVYEAPKSGASTLYSDRLLTPEDPAQVVGITGHPAK
jgi:hypothetical protein